MKVIYAVVLITILISQLVISCVSVSVPESFNLLSFNIRYNTEKDGENAWPYRKQHVAELIQFHQADIIGLQEARLGQLEDLMLLLPNYAWYGLSRDDGKSDSAGEYAAILYRKDKLKLQEQGTFWCSTTPEIPSKGWDAKYKRNVNWGLFSRLNGQSFYLFNTHFDHKGKTSREECSKLLRTSIEQITDDTAVMVTGDFNVKPNEQVYANIIDNSLYKSELFDASSSSNLQPYGPQYTLTGFNINAVNDKMIDYIFVNNKVTVQRFGVLTDSKNGRLPSDHYPILVEVGLH